MRNHSIIILILLLLPFGLKAQKVYNVCGEYTYYGDANQSPNEAKRIALENARLQALANEFGTVISQSTTQQETALNGKESSYFSQLNRSEVKGELLEDVGEPKYEMSFVDDMTVVKCSVCGKAREISNEAAEFNATILKNGTEPKFADVNFHHEDDMYLWFQAPTDGYVSVYLIDETRNAYCLLPYNNDADGQQQVKHNEEYVFFSIKKAKEEADLVDEYTLTCSNDIERNQIYVIFSPKPFTKATDKQISDALPRQLDFEDFQKWLTTRRKRDTQMGVKVMHLEIKKINVQFKKKKL